MKQWFTYFVAILLTLLCTAALAWPWFKHIRGMKVYAHGIVANMYVADGRFKHNYYISISNAEVFVVLAVLIGGSFILAVVCSWLFGYKSKAY